MQSTKAILFSAAFGFVLSFLFGLLSHSFILLILLKALLFAVVFAGAGFLISLLYNNYLSEDSAADMSMDTSNDVSVQPSVSNVGANVDLVVSDEELPESDSENQYTVNDSSKQMLNSTDLSKASVARSSAPVVEPKVSHSGKINPSESIPDDIVEETPVPVTPMPEMPSSAASQQAAAQATVQVPEQSPVQASAASNNSGEEALDTLPDMNAFVIENNEENSENNDDTAMDSSDDFSTTVVSNSGSRKSDSADIQDAAIMAKAISSILSNEES